MIPALILLSGGKQEGIGLTEGRKGILLWAEERPVADCMAQTSREGETPPGSLASDSMGLRQAR